MYTHTAPTCTYAHTAKGFQLYIQHLPEGVHICASLPVFILTMFVFVVQFLYNEFTMIKVNLLDSFINIIQYNIRRVKMPPFSFF